MLMLGVLAGCVSLPGIDSIEQQALQNPPPAGSMSDDTGLLQAVNREDLDYVRQVSRIEAAVARTPLVGGNRLRLLKDGPSTHAAQLGAIAGAHHSIHLAIYIFTDDELGRRYLKALVAKARAGVQVRVIVDGLGAGPAVENINRQLTAAGAELREFNSVDPLKDLRLWRVVQRNHRKILVVDGKTAFTGGINISDDYLSSSSGSGGSSGSGHSFTGSSGSSGSAHMGWRDTQVQIDGPAVAQFQKVFLHYWQRLGDAAPKGAWLYPHLAAHGTQFVRVITDNGADLADNATAPLTEADDAGGGKKAHNARIYSTYLSAIHAARKRVWITQAYFSPDKQFTDELDAAAARGVDVRLLMPGGGDVKMMMYAAHARYAGLLKAGLHLYEYKDTTVLHAKTAVIDGVWSTVGSANLDYRSFIFNDEANAIVIGSDFAQQMEAMFEDDLRSADEIKPEEWSRRPWSDRLKETFAVTISRLL